MRLRVRGQYIIGKSLVGSILGGSQKAILFDDPLRPIPPRIHRHISSRNCRLRGKNIMSLREQVNDRVWYEDENKTSFAFLVRAPITFGHSQVMSISSDTHEEENFRKAADHIGICIQRFRSALMLNFEE